MLTVIVLNGMVEFTVLGSIVLESVQKTSLHETHDEHNDSAPTAEIARWIPLQAAPRNGRFSRLKCCTINLAPVVSNPSCRCSDCGSKCPGGSACRCGKEHLPLPAGIQLVSPPCHPGQSQSEESPLPPSLSFRFWLEHTADPFWVLESVEVAQQAHHENALISWVPSPTTPPPQSAA